MFNNKEWRHKNKDKLNKNRRERYRTNPISSTKKKEAARRYYHTHKDNINYKSKERDRHKKYTLKYRMLVIEHYGGKCACCGEKELKFLTVDHTNGVADNHKGTSYRKGTGLYLWLIKNNFPIGFQILCWNCNCAKGQYGACPHSLVVSGV